MALPTSSQTVGPFFSCGLLRNPLNDLVRPETRGDRITIVGRVLDGDGVPVPDAMIEIWQANADGRYRHPEDDQEARLDPAFEGFGRVGTDANGAFRFNTIKPGAVPGPDAKLQAPHINVTVFARGLLNHLSTRIYLSGEVLNATDKWLQAVKESRRRTLIATPENAPGAHVYHFDIVLQGKDETVFFDF